MRAPPAGTARHPCHPPVPRSAQPLPTRYATPPLGAPPTSRTARSRSAGVLTAHHGPPTRWQARSRRSASSASAASWSPRSAAARPVPARRRRRPPHAPPAHGTPANRAPRLSQAVRSRRLPAGRGGTALGLPAPTARRPGRRCRQAVRVSAEPAERPTTHPMRVIWVTLFFFFRVRSPTSLVCPCLSARTRNGRANARRVGWRADAVIRFQTSEERAYRTSRRSSGAVVDTCSVQFKKAVEQFGCIVRMMQTRR